MLGAQEEAPKVTPFELGYSIRSWSTDDGLSHSIVSNLLLDSTGYLLIGSTPGITRYNGIGFEEVSSASGETSVLQVLQFHEDREGNLWYAGLGGQGIWDRISSFQTIGPDRGGRGGITAYAEDAEGRIWCAVSSVEGSVMLSVFENGVFVMAIDEPVMCGYAKRLMFDHEGGLWLTVVSLRGDHSLFKLQGRQLVPHPVPGELPLCLFRSAQSPSTLQLAGGQGIYAWEDGQWKQTLELNPPIPERRGINACVVDPDGNHWIGTRTHGLWVCSPDGQARRLTEQRKLASFIRDIVMSSDGTVWVNGESGLIQLYRQPFTRWPASESFENTIVRSVTEDGNGVLWFASNGIYQLNPEGMVIEHQPESGQRLNVFVVSGRREGGTWFTTWGGPLMLQTADGMARIATVPRGERPYTRNIVELGEEVWVCKEFGIFRAEGDQLVSNAPPSMQGRTPTYIEDAGDGQLLAGYENSGVFLYRGGNWESYGLEDVPVTTLTRDSDGGLWARCGFDGLAWRPEGGEWKMTTVSQIGAPPNFTVLCASDGSLWFHAHQSPLVRMQRKALEAWLDGDRDSDLQRRLFGREEGLTSEHASEIAFGRSLLEDSQGRIWVATDRGACVHDPSQWRQTPLTKNTLMPVRIEKIKVDQADPIPPPSRLVLKPNQRQFEIHYVGIDLTNPKKVAYRYRLRGFDDEWNDVGPRHVAYYQDLPPGNYEFHVIGADRHGIWNEVGASLPLTIQPYWWERRSVRVSLPLLLALLMAAAVYVKMRAKNRLAEERAHVQAEFSRRLIEAQEAERGRIAADLHDDFGQDLLVMKGRVDMARRMMGSEEHEPVLKQLADTTLDLIKKARSLSHQLRPMHLEHLGLSSCVNHLVKDFYEASPIEFETEIDDLEGLLPGDTEIIVYRLIQESLNNIMKHADAQKVSLRMKRQEDTLFVSISDDGKGFDPEHLEREKRKIGQGLAAMKERCVLIGAQLRIHSEPGKGTTLQFALPIPQPPTEDGAA